MVGDGTWLTIGEVVARLIPLGVSTDRARFYADNAYLRTQRPPAVGRGTPHRRIEAASVDELEDVLRMMPGPRRDEALGELRQRNLGKDDDAPGPTPEEGQGQQDH